MTMKWDASVARMATVALRDGILSHPDVVNLIIASLDQGSVSLTERQNLEHLAQRAKLPRSKRLIRMFTELHRQHAFAGRLKLPAIATHVVCEFLKKNEQGKFTQLDRDEVGIGIILRLIKPGSINQDVASLCGPVAVLFALATHSPTEYARYAVDLYDNGRARLGRMDIRPSADCRNYRPPPGTIHPVDWLTAASLRDSENWFLDYDSVEDEVAGMTRPGALADWFSKAGFRDVRNVTNVFFNKGRGTLDEVRSLHDKGYRVCLFIGAKMLDAVKQKKGTTFADHWAVLTKIVRISDTIELELYTWGDGHYRVPQGGTLTAAKFYDNFYGYVAAKP